MNFDEILTLITTFEEGSLTELHLEHDDTTLSLKRESPDKPVYSQPIMVHPQTLPLGQPMPLAPPSPPPAEEVTADVVKGEEREAPAGVEVITSPIVGSIYRSPSPDSPPFCAEGDVIEKGKTLCIIEAMKVMNELEAEFEMEIVAFKVNNGDMVEFGTPLIEVRRV